MMPFQKPVTQILRDLASKIFEQKKHNLDASMDAYDKQVRADPKLFNAAIEPLWRAHVSEIFHDLNRKNRSAGWHGDHAARETDRERGKGNVAVLARATRTMLMETPLIPGKTLPLGDAVRSDVKEAYEYYHVRGDDSLHKSRMLEMVYGAMTEGKTVRQCLTERQLQNFKKKTAASNL